jgi:hypothetical protein
MKSEAELAKEAEREEIKKYGVSYKIINSGTI